MQYKFCLPHRQIVHYTCTDTHTQHNTPTTFLVCPLTDNSTLNEKQRMSSVSKIRLNIILLLHTLCQHKNTKCTAILPTFSKPRVCACLILTCSLSSITHTYSGLAMVLGGLNTAASFSGSSVQLGTFEVRGPNLQLFSTCTDIMLSYPSMIQVGSSSINAAAGLVLTIGLNAMLNLVANTSAASTLTLD